MTKVLKCGELMHGFGFEARGDSIDQILQQAAAHANEALGLDATPELVEQVKCFIRDE